MIETHNFNQDPLYMWDYAVIINALAFEIELGNISKEYLESALEAERLERLEATMEKLIYQYEKLTENTLNHTPVNKILEMAKHNAETHHKWFETFKKVNK